MSKWIFFMEHTAQVDNARWVCKWFITWFRYNFFKSRHSSLLIFIDSAPLRPMFFRMKCGNYYFRSTLFTSLVTSGIYFDFGRSSTGIRSQKTTTLAALLRCILFESLHFPFLNGIYCNVVMVAFTFTTKNRMKQNQVDWTIFYCSKNVRVQTDVHTICGRGRPGMAYATSHMHNNFEKFLNLAKRRANVNPTNVYLKTQWQKWTKQ